MEEAAQVAVWEVSAAPPSPLLSGVGEVHGANNESMAAIKGNGEAIVGAAASDGAQL
jgi:hypothetical protein